MDQANDSVNNFGGFAFGRGCREGVTKTKAWVQGHFFPRHVEVVTRFPVSGNSMDVIVVQWRGRVSLSIGFIIPDDRTPCYPQNGEYPQVSGQLWALTSKEWKIYSKRFDSKCKKDNCPQKFIEKHERDCQITEGVTLRIYWYVKEKNLYFSIDGKEYLMSTCGKQELNSCYGFVRLSCEDDDSKIEVSLPGINDEAFANVGSLETAHSNKPRDLAVPNGHKTSQAFANVGSLETAHSNKPRDLSIPTGHKTSEAALPVVGSRENVTAPSNTLGDLPISVGCESHEKNQYTMNRPGICLLINNLKNSTGEEILLTNLFSSLGFHVEVKQNLSMFKILGVAHEFGLKDLSSYDSFVFILLSQCRQDGVIVVDGRKVELEQVMSEFRPFNNESLKNKPKLFFVLRSKTQSAKRHSGGTEFCTDTPIELPQSCNTSIQEVCSQEADFLLVCVTSPFVKGKKIKPSFTEMMVNVFRTYHQTYDLLEMLTLLNHRTDNLHKKNGQSNVMVTHTLRYKVRFDSVQTHEPQISTQSSIPGLPSLSSYDEHKTECPGYCVIINNRQFQGNDETYREGSEQDVESLRNLFESLRFEVVIKRDLKRDQIKEVAQEYGGKNHDKFVAFVLIVMSHGDEKDCILGVDNDSISVWRVMKEFQAEKCPSLKGKPKILIIQTCRGSRQCDIERSGDFVQSINADPTELDLADNCVDPFSLDSSLFKSVFPPETDFLLAFATVPGYVSFRSPTSGSFFIQELVKVIEEYHGSHHLLDMLTEVTRRVIDHQNREFDPTRYRVQVPAPAHTLTKLLYL